MANSPISSVDPDGGKPFDWFKRNKNGSLTRVKKTNDNYDVVKELDGSFTYFFHKAANVSAGLSKSLAFSLRNPIARRVREYQGLWAKGMAEMGLIIAPTPKLHWAGKAVNWGLKGLGRLGKAGRVAKGGSRAFSLTRHGQLTDGVYTVSKEAMKKHVVGGVQGRSMFYPTLNAEEAVLKTARYADEMGLWINGGAKAKVPILNTNIGTTGLGKPTNIINVYRKPNGMIHGSPGN